jgi:hypothetical protein
MDGNKKCDNKGQKLRQTVYTKEELETKYKENDYYKTAWHGAYGGTEWQMTNATRTQKTLDGPLKVSKNNF